MADAIHFVDGHQLRQNQTGGQSIFFLNAVKCAQIVTICVTFLVRIYPWDAGLSNSTRRHTEYTGFSASRYI